MDSHEDGPLISAISKQQGGRIPEIKRLGTPRMSQLRFARMEAVIAMRLHAGILAATVGVPPIMISYDPKVTAFARQLDIGAALPLESLTPQRLFDSFRTHHKNMDKMRPIVEKKRIELLSEAMKSVELANEILR
jgi:polysaccharide pyruvyl transferase WcaK-like protein